MKKMLIGAAVVCATVASQAASIKWSSGSIVLPGEGGVLSSDRLTNSSGFSLKMYAWESLTASTLAYNAGDMFKWYQNGASGTAFAGTTTINGTVNMSASATTATAIGTIVPEANPTTVYGAVLFVLEDETTGAAKWYMENSGSKESAAAVQTLNNLASKVGGTGDATKWSPVPEPTSGLLMLLGMAGLALRRKRT